jgi:hypothetical protein
VTENWAARLFKGLFRLAHRLLSAVALGGSLPTRDTQQHDTPPDAKYTNYMAVGFNAYEFILEFGHVIDDEPVRVHTRLIMTPAIVNLLCRSLCESVRQYGESFGLVDGPSQETAGEPLESGE